MGVLQHQVAVRRRYGATTTSAGCRWEEAWVYYNTRSLLGGGMGPSTDLGLQVNRHLLGDGMEDASLL